MIGLGWHNKQQGDAIPIDSREWLLSISSRQGENTGHDGRSDVVVHRVGDDPIRHGILLAWKNPTLEIYDYARGPARRMHVLSYGYGQHTRMTWPLESTARFGRGRVYSSTFGHVWKGDVQPPACAAPESRRCFCEPCSGWLNRCDPSRFSDQGNLNSSGDTDSCFCAVRHK